MNDGKPIPYDQYLQYYGNPDRHVYLGCVAEVQCPCCDHWESDASVWHIDFMDDDPELSAVNVGKAIPAMDAMNLPGYAGEIAREMLAESGMQAAKREQRKQWKAQQKERDTHANR